MRLFPGTRPKNLGAPAGKLRPAPRTPNGVSSQADPSDPEHYIEPIRFAGNPAKAWAKLIAALRATPRVAVITDKGKYMHAECSSALLGFVDDLECVLDRKAGLIHVRSAARLGRRDFGVNRARVEALRKAMS